MSQYYVGVKIVEAFPYTEITTDGQKEGYKVRYPDGYTSWSPKDVFESAYLPMGDGNDNRVTPEMVDKFLGFTKSINLPDKKSTLVKAETISGFVQYEVSSCVDPANYDIDIGTGIGIERIKNVLWKCLGFVVQWGKFGLNNKEERL